MSQSTLIKVPTTLHAQLKALAAARGTTMTAVIHRAVQEAIANNEIPDELPGYQLKIELDLDTKPGEIVSAFTVTTKAGEWPVMDGDDLAQFAETLATMQPNASPRGEAVDCTLVKGGRIEAGFIGNAIKIEAHHRGSDISVTNVLTVAGARDLARQLAKNAQPLTV